MELSTMSTPELRRLQGKVTRELQKRESAERSALLRQFKKLAAEKGLKLEEVLPIGFKKTAAAEPVAKAPRRGRQIKNMAAKKRANFVYFNPANPAQGWSGHGRRPQWVLDWQAAGKSMEDLKQKPEAAAPTA